jgi:hypothetical protein
MEDLFRVSIFGFRIFSCVATGGGMWITFSLFVFFSAIIKLFMALKFFKGKDIKGPVGLGIVVLGVIVGLLLVIWLIRLVTAPVVTISGVVIGVSENSFVLGQPDGASFQLAVTERTQFQFPSQELAGPAGLRSLGLSDSITVETLGELEESGQGTARKVVVQPAVGPPQVPFQVFNLTGTILRINEGSMLVVKSNTLGEAQQFLVNFNQETRLKNKIGAPISLDELIAGSEVLIETQENLRTSQTITADSIRLLD